MKRAALALALATALLAGGLAAPARAAASVQELRQCVDSHVDYFAEDPEGRYYVFAFGVYMCSVHFGYRMTSETRLTALRQCLYAAVRSYQPVTGVEPPAHYAYRCADDYLGVGIAPG